MNQKEKQYILKRIGEIATILHNKAFKKYEDKQHKRLNTRDKMDLIIRGKVQMFSLKKMKENLNKEQWIHNTPELSRVFDFSGHEWEHEQSKKRGEVLQAVTTEKNRISDEIMLGDSEEAMKALKEFANFKI